MKFSFGISLTLFLLMIASGIHAQTADAVIDRNEILIGEQAVISLSVSYEKGRLPEVIFPEPEDTLVEKVEVLRVTEVDTLRTGENVSRSRLQKQIFITSFDSGYYAIPPFILKVNGEEQLTQAFLLTVKTVEVDTAAGIKDIKGIYEVDVTWMDYVSVYWPYGAGALGLAALIVAIIFAVRHYRRKRAERDILPPPEPPRPADIIAREELERIRKEKAYERGLVKAYHTEITDVIRDYLEAVAEIPAHELTSGQIMHRLRYSGLSEKENRLLRVILFRADMVKFAKEIPDVDENQGAVTEAREFIDSTAPKWMREEIAENE